MPSREEPEGWGADPLSSFLLEAQKNGYAAFTQLRGPFTKLARIAALFREAVDQVDRSADYVPALFLLRAHASYLGGVRLALSGQLAEAYMVLRGALESALYGLHLAIHPGLAETWLKRGSSEQWRKQSKKEFTFRRANESLRSQDPVLAAAAEELYERAIDFGGHPNSPAFLQSLGIKDSLEGRRLELNYLTVERVAHDLCLKSAAQVGVVCLRVFGLIYRERFEISGLAMKVEKEAGTL